MLTKEIEGFNIFGIRFPNGTKDSGTFTKGTTLIESIGYFLGLKWDDKDGPVDKFILESISAHGPEYKAFVKENNGLNLILEGEEPGLYRDFYKAFVAGLERREKSSDGKKDPTSAEVGNGAIADSHHKFKNSNKSPGSGSGSGSNNPDNTAVIDEDHQDKDLQDLDYKYHTGSDGKSFSWTSINDSNKKGKHVQGDKNWAQMVTRLNALTVPATPAAATPATPATDTAQATTAETAYNSTESVLGSVLAAMYNNKLVGTPGLDLRNELRVAKIIMDGVAGTVGTGNRASSATARILLAVNPGLKDSLPDDSTYQSLVENKEFLGSLQQAINGLYKTAFAWSKNQSKDSGQHRGFWERIKA